MPSSIDREKIVLPHWGSGVTAAELRMAIDGLGTAASPSGSISLGDEAAIRTVERAFLHNDESPRRMLLARGRADPAFAARMVDHILPEVARRLESGWGEDRLSFVDVTIAAARVQDALRALGRIELPRPDAKTVALIVPPWEQHTLAAAFAAQTMRGLGAQVRTITGPSVAVIAALVSRAPVSAVMMSISSEAARERAPDLLLGLRRAVPQALPFVVGGAIAAGRPASVCPRGADFLARDCEEALGFCKFPLSHPEGAGEMSDA